MTGFGNFTFTARVRGNGLGFTGCMGMWTNDNGNIQTTNLIYPTSQGYQLITPGTINNVNNGSILMSCNVASLFGSVNGGVLWVNA
jgi:hypothetical protein